MFCIFFLMGEKQYCGDFKAIEKGGLLFESDRIF